MALSNVKARKMASELLQLKVEAKQIADKKKEIEAKLIEYIEATGVINFGEVIAYAQRTPPKLVTTDGSKSIPKGTAADLIVNIGEDYLVTKLNVKAMNENKANDTTLRRLLRKAKLDVVQEDTWRFKHVD